MKISIFGIGYVGTVTAACLCDMGHEIIAIDKNTEKLDTIDKGQSPIVETDLEELITKCTKEGKLTTTVKVSEAIKTEISLICVGTPSNNDGSLDMSYVKTVCKEIGQALKNADNFHTVVLRSTMLPGSAKNICLPILEEYSGKKAGKDFGFGSNPEFLREGSAVSDFYEPPKIVVGADDKKSADIIMSIYKSIDAPRIITDINIAEGVKYADNVWHAMKVGFANEIGNILSDHDIDSHAVMDIFCLDKKLNISEAYLRPGFAFGGSCLPKDLRAICAAGKIKGLSTPLFDSLLIANDNQINRAAEKIKKLGAKNIALLGISFKAGTDDLRESPLVKLLNILLASGLNVRIYDPDVYKTIKSGNATAQYIKDNLAQISDNIIARAEDIKTNADLFVIGNKDDSYADIIKSINCNTPILDLVRLDQDIEKKAGYHGICW